MKVGRDVTYGLNETEADRMKNTRGWMHRNGMDQRVANRDRRERTGQEMRARRCAYLSSGSGLPLAWYIPWN